MAEYIKRADVMKICQQYSQHWDIQKLKERVENESI